jgi:hypothetical protein
MQFDCQVTILVFALLRNTLYNSNKWLLVAYVIGIYDMLPNRNIREKLKEQDCCFFNTQTTIFVYYIRLVAQH